MDRKEDLLAITPRLFVSIKRKVPVATYPFMNYFKGFEKVDAVKRIFGKELKKF